MEITVGGLDHDDVLALLAEHLRDMHATSPAESIHALDVSALSVPEVTFFSVREDGVLLGCGALTQTSPGEGEVKSMRTAAGARGRGVGAATLGRILEEARARGYRRVSLETGSQDYFAPAHRLYARHGFTPCGPFGDYALDDNSRYFTLEL